MRNCVDIVRPFAAELANSGIDNVQLFGGVGSFSLEHSGTRIIMDEKLVVAPGDLYLPQYRENGKRNLRDLDCLVKSTDADVVDSIEEIARDCIGAGVLDLSVFGYRPASQLEDQIENPIKSLGKVNVSDRYVEEENDEVLFADKALFPFAVDMPISTLENWQLQIGNNPSTMPIPHPGATILNYLTRSITGLRPKDADKVDRLTSNIAEKSPEIIDWIVDGDGASQLDFARILHTLRERRGTDRSLEVGGVLQIKPYELSSLTRHDAFMLPGYPKLMRGLVEVEHVKSHGAHYFEKHPAIVTFWQKHVEPRIQGILKNK